jgi:hypothetical protein
MIEEDLILLPELCAIRLQQEGGPVDRRRLPLGDHLT